MFRRLDTLCHLPCPAKVFHRLGAAACGVIDTGKGYERVQRMPFIFRGLHQPIGRLIFLRSLVILLCFLVERAEVGVAKRYTEVVACLHIQHHRATVIDPSRVRLPPMLEDGAEVGVVDGQSQSAIKFSLSFQRHAQYAVGTFVVTQSEIDVSQSVERDHAVLLRGERSIGTFLAQYPCPVMILLRHIEHTHATVVGTDVVQGLHSFYGVADGFRLSQSLTVGAQRLLEAALVAQRLTPFPEGYDAAQYVPLAFHTFLQ